MILHLYFFDSGLIWMNGRLHSLYYVYLLIRYIPYHEHFAAQEKHAGLLRRETYGISEQALKQAGLGLDH